MAKDGARNSLFYRPLIQCTANTLLVVEQIARDAVCAVLCCAVVYRIGVYLLMSVYLPVLADGPWTARTASRGAGGCGGSDFSALWSAR